MFKKKINLLLPVYSHYYFILGMFQNLPNLPWRTSANNSFEC